MSPVLNSDQNSHHLDPDRDHLTELQNANPDLDLKPKKKIGFGVIAAIGLFLLTKGKFILLALSKVKFLSSSLSMFVSIAAYALFWGWKFAVGFVLLLFIHEIGHVIQLRREGVEASAPMFVPFLGAFIAAKSLGNDAGAEARVGLAGPIVGSLGAFVPLIIWLLTGNEFFQALAFVGFFLNLFNLLPVLPLDGGRAMAALSPKVWFFGAFLVVALTVLTLNPLLILILILGGIEGWSRWKNRNTQEGQAFLSIERSVRVKVALTYFILVVSLTALMYWTYLEKPIGG